MKKISLTIFCVAFISMLHAQDSTETKIRKNEFGFEITGLFRQFFDPGNSFYLYNGYKPTYYITYRRYFKHGNLRTGFGGDFSYWDIPNGVPYSRPQYKNVYESIDGRVGYEFKVNVGKRWQAFYGMDYQLSYVHQQSDENSLSNGYAEGVEKNSTIMGLAPLAGIRFSITDRLSLSTETSFSFNLETNETRLYYTSTDLTLYAPKPDVGPTRANAFYTSYQQPIDLFLCLTF